MNDELDGAPDQQIEAAVTQTYAAHARKIGQPTGRLDDVLRRVGRRRNKRRAMAGIASVALVGAGVAGIVAAGGMGSEAPAAGAGGPSTTLARNGDGWFVCSGAIERDGATVYDWCELETPYANPAWSCSGEVVDPAVDGDDRPRFENCAAVGEANEYTKICAPATVVPTTANQGGTRPIQPTPTTWVADLCAPMPTTTTTIAPPNTRPLQTVPCHESPIASDSAGNCYGVPLPSSPGAPMSTITIPLSTPGNGVVPTTEPAATTSAPSANILALGDSVMMGAADVLGPRGWTVMAQTTMQLADLVPIVENLVASSAIGPGTETVIIHAGTNGTFSKATLDAVLAPLADVPNVLLYTIRADRSWTEPNNELLRAADSRPNVVLIDWEVRSEQCIDDCFADDGIHLKENGKVFYADLARDWTGG